MKLKGYLVFHLNLAFSSIEEEAREDVINSCYHPLLDLIEQTKIPVGIELTGWTLQQIERIDASWIERFKNSLSAGKCELIGSGYCQIIGPLAPVTLNEWNQKLGLEIYKSVLGCRPSIALVNEMVFSSSLIDLYQKFGYSGVMSDRDNMRSALGFENSPINAIPNYGEGPEGAVLPILWSDSILFQKAQQFAHGDIGIDQYLNYLQRRIEDGELIFPIYTNDAEVFDYRPGRFGEERPTHTEGEWNRLRRLLENITDKKNIEFVTPTHALEAQNRMADRRTFMISDAAYPIPVKKQAKYNISRWAVTGRDDFWLNTMCFRIEKQLVKSNNNKHSDWRNLCELWASDLRTHITDNRWAKAKSKLHSELHKHSVSDRWSGGLALNRNLDSLSDVIGAYGDFETELNSEEILLSISTKKIKLDLNLRRGLAITNLAFSSHEMKPCIGTLPHGHFKSISLGADYYSGSTVVELPLKRQRVTDLEKVDPKFRLNGNGNIEIFAEINTNFGSIIKVVEVSVDREQVMLSYDFPGWDKVTGSIRVGAITLLDHFACDDTKIRCANGGRVYENFRLGSGYDHTRPASTLVSSSRGLGATTGQIVISNNGKNINLNWDPSECAVMPMLQKNACHDKELARLFFSMNEVDDTSKFPSHVGRFTFSIAAS